MAGGLNETDPSKNLRNFDYNGDISNEDYITNDHTTNRVRV